MGHPKIEGVGHGKPVMPFGSDGEDWYALLVSALGRLQVDVLSAVLGTGGATAANQTTMITALQLIDDLRNALLTVATDRLGVRATEIETLLSGGLPAALDSGALKTKEQSPLTGFATSANQTTMITALQLIDDLRAALGSVNTDDLQVDIKTYPGVNALLNIPFGYNAQYLQTTGTTTAGAGDNYLYGSIVPAGEIWVVTSIATWDVNTNPSVIGIGIEHSGSYYTLKQAPTPGLNTVFSLNNPTYLAAGDRVYVYFGGCTLNDDIYITINGYKMKVA